MANLNRQCKVCGTKYSYCPTCSGDTKKPKWMKMFDCEECKTIFDTATKFNLGQITQIEAQKSLNGINLDREFTEPIKQDLSNIFYEEPVENVVVEEKQPVKKSKRSKKSESEFYGVTAAYDGSFSGTVLATEDSHVCTEPSTQD